jgi:hypothetical protein
MTKTEERLRDYLGAVADSVRPDNTRPLAAAGRPASGDALRPASRRRTWLPPLAAAASVALIAAGVVAAGGYLHHRDNPPGPAGPAAGPPRYYATLEGNNQTDLDEVVIRATGTGAAVARIQDPVSPIPPGTGTAAPPSSTATPNPYASLMQPLDITTTDDRTFYAVYATQTATGYGDLLIESFHLSDAGQASPLARVNGGQLSGHGTTRYTGGSGVTPLVGGFAVSPDNGKIALALKASPADAAAEEILVTDTRTGAHTVWRGGLDRAGAAFAILGLSWTADSRSLAFLAQWCSPRQRADGNIHSQSCGGTRSAQVRELDTALPGGSLSIARLLLAQSPRYPYIGRAAISPDGTSLTALLLSGPVPPNKGFGPGAPERFSIVRISVATGLVTAALFHGVDPVSMYSTLTVESTGRYVMLAHTDVVLRPADTPYAAGWIDAGHFRQLPPNAGEQGVAW